MKKAMRMFLAGAALMLSVSCYEDVIGDYEYPNMGFALRTPKRTVIAHGNPVNSEKVGSRIYVGVSIGGKREVDMSDWATFAIDERIMDSVGTQFHLLPEEYYQLDSPDRMKVRKSNMAVADVGITFTSEFYADPLSATDYYALPFVITGTSLPDKKDAEGVVHPGIRSGAEVTVVAVKYVSGFAGTYYRVGSYVEVDASGTEIGERVSYAKPDLSRNETVTFSTKERLTVVRPGLGEQSSSVGSLALTVEPVKGDSEFEVIVEGEGGAVISDATGVYRTKGDYTFYGGDTIAPQFDLEYTYTVGGKSYRVKEKLVLRQLIELSLRLATY